MTDAVRARLRAVSLALLLLVSLAGVLYCVLLAVPFTYEQFIVPKVSPALHSFARGLPLLLLATLGGALTSEASPFANRRAKLAGCIGLAISAGLLGTGALSEPSGGPASIVLGLVVLAYPVLALTSVARNPGVPDGRASIRIFLSLSAAGVSLALLGTLRDPSLWDLSLSGVLVASAAIASVAALVESITAGLSRRMPISPVLATLLQAWLFLGVIFPEFSFSGPGAWILAIASSAVTGWTVASLPVRRSVPSSGLPARAGLGVAILVTTWILQPALSSIDWNFLAQKLLILAAWGLFAVLLAPALPVQRIRSSALIQGIGFLALAAWVLTERGSTPPPAGAHALARLLRENILPGPVTSDSAQYYSALVQAANLPPGTPLRAPEVSLDRATGYSQERKPDLFLIVVDSLRQDRIEPYSTSVRTPGFARLAADSVVFRDAFSRYGATGLSVPSIWSGMMQPHRQYVAPFSPMNTLEKLIELEGYVPLLTMDSVARKILSPPRDLVALDPGKLSQDVDLCSTLEELRGRLSQRKAAGESRPVFFYSLPQDLHVSVLERLPGPKPLPEKYGDAVQRIDGCLARFMDWLRAEDLYRQSVIVVTSDHGDSLGEGGRFGHAYTIYDEILRVPLIVKPPESMKPRLSRTAASPVFTTGIAPTLARIVGREVRAPERSWVVGKPLLSIAGGTREDAEPDEPQLVASSYGPVFGLLADRGRTLYIADAVNLREQLFRLGGGEPVELPLGNGLRERYRQITRRRIEELKRFHGPH